MSENSKSISLAKLTPPQLPPVLERMRLFVELDELRASHRVIWIQGPPGAGKTTLVGSYLQTRQLKPLWYQLDEGDADPGTWFHYLNVGMKHVAPRYKTPLPALRPEYLPTLPTFTRRFFEQLYPRLKSSSVVVFDNYQEVPQDASFHQLMNVALCTIPSDVTVIVLSRQPVPPTLARLQVNQLLGVVNPEHLLLTLGETKAFVQLRWSSTGTQATALAMQAIHEKTQGWVAGVVLLLSHQDSAGAHMLESSQEVTPVVFDYLALEVLRTREKDEVELLLHTSWFPSFTARMAIQLTGQSTADRTLKKFVRARYFTERRGGSEPTYQYHPLFRTFLQQEATARWSTAQLETVRRQAAAHLEQAERIDDAVTMYVEAKQFEEVERLILQQAPIVFAEGRAFTLERWVQGMPAGQRDANPWLRYWEASCQFVRNPNKSVPLFEHLHKEFERIHDEGGKGLAWCGVIEGILYSYTDYRRLDPWIDRLLPQIMDIQNEPFPSKDIEARVTVTLFAAMLWVRLADPRMFELEERVQKILQGLPDVSRRIQIGFHVFIFWSWLGDMKRVGVMYRTCEEWSKQSQVSPLAQAFFFFIKATYGWHIGNALQTLEACHQGRQLVREYGLAMLKMSYQGASAMGALLTCDYDHLARLEEDLRVQEERTPSIHITASHHMASVASFVQGRENQAFMHAEKMWAISSSLTSEFLKECHRYHVGLLLIERGLWESAEHEIQCIEQTAQRLPSLWLPYFVYSLRAQLEVARGKKEEGKQALQRWLCHSQQHQLLGAFMYLPPIMSRLCAKALDAGIEVEHVRSLINKLNLLPEHPYHTSDQWPWPVKVYTLGRFEVMNEDVTIQFGRKVPKTPLALLKVLIVLGGQEISPSQVIDRLWPDADGDAAYRSLKMAVSRLRKLLQREDTIIFSGGTLSLNENVCWVDSLNFSHLVTQVTLEAKQGNEAKSFEHAERARRLYSGDFLPHDDVPWVFKAREHLQNQHATLMTSGRFQS